MQQFVGALENVRIYRVYTEHKAEMADGFETSRGGLWERVWGRRKQSAQVLR